MIQRLHYFNELCALLLAFICVIAFVSSLIEARGWQQPTWKVVCCELPILIYVLLLAGFLLPHNLPGIQPVLVGVFAAALIVAFPIRFFSYSIRREARERARLLASHAEVSQKIEEARIQVMSAMEKKAFLEAVQPKRKSRYERNFVI